MILMAEGTRRGKHFEWLSSRSSTACSVQIITTCSRGRHCADSWGSEALRLEAFPQRANSVVRLGLTLLGVDKIH